MSLYQIRMEGWKALTERLGPSGAMRFMMQYDPGYGDYTKERQEVFADLTIENAIDDRSILTPICMRSVIGKQRALS